MNVSKWILTVACFAVLPAASMAATITYEATFNGVQHQFSGGSGLAFTSFTLSGPAPKLNGALTGGDQLKIVYSAPAGMQFNVFALPGNAILGGIYADLWSENSLSGSSESEPGVSILLTGDSGLPPAPVRFLFENNLSGRFRAILEVPAFSRSFTRLTAVFDIPSSMNRTFTDLTPSMVNLAVFAALRSNVDPGPLASITPIQMSDVPEPSTLALVGGALSVLVLLKRRPRRC